MSEKVHIQKVYMTSGAVLYWKGNSLELRAFVNASNARGGNVGTAYTDEAMQNEVQFALSNVEYFHSI